MYFSNITKLTKKGNYEVDICLKYLHDTINNYVEKYNLDLSPDFQRNYVWKENQKIKWVEFVLKGGSTTPLYFNHPGWMSNWEGDFIVVDGKQRLEALIGFLNNKVPAFGFLYREYLDKLSLNFTIKININNLKTKREVLNWYLEMNTGGTVHTDEEINKVRAMLKKLEK